MCNTNNNAYQLKIIALNVNSLIKITRRHNLDAFLNENKPDFLLISETKLKSIHKLALSNYEIHRTDRLNDAGGGTAVLFKNSYKTEQIMCDLNISSFEYTMTQVFLNNNESIFIIAIYKPPSQQLNVRELDKLIKECGNSKFVIGGDFNAKHRSWCNNVNENNGVKLNEWLNNPTNKLNLMMLTGIDQTCERSTNSFIDLIIFSKTLINYYLNNNYNQLSVIPYYSDHNAIVFMCIIDSNICAKSLTYKYLYKNVKWNIINKKIENKLSELGLPSIRNLHPNEIDYFAENLQQIICTVTDKHIRKIPINENLYIQESNQTKVLKNNLKILQRRKKRARNTQSLNDIQNSIALIKNMITNSLENDYRIFWCEKLKNISVNNDVFGNIRRCSKYGKKNATSSVMIDSQSKAYSTDRDKANFLAQKFLTNHEINPINNDANFISEVKRKTEPLKNSEFIVHFNDVFTAKINRNDNSDITGCIYKANEIFLTVEKTLKIVKSRNNKKSSGCDNMNNFIIKNLSVKTWEFITILFNHIINSACTPNIWKRATIVPIPKNNQNCNNIEQQRPISMINPISKIIEKHMTEIAQQFCETNNIIPAHQYGFQKHTSTVHSLLNFQNTIIRAVNDGMPAQAIFLDIEKAFDTVWIEGLIYKMLSFGFDKCICRYFFNYATNRKFAVKISNFISNFHEPATGGCFFAHWMGNLHG